MRSTPPSVSIALPEEHVAHLNAQEWTQPARPLALLPMVHVPTLALLPMVHVPTLALLPMFRMPTRTLTRLRLVCRWALPPTPGSCVVAPGHYSADKLEHLQLTGFLKRGLTFHRRLYQAIVALGESGHGDCCAADERLYGKSEATIGLTPSERTTARFRSLRRE